MFTNHIYRQCAYSRIHNSSFHWSNKSRNNGSVITQRATCSDIQCATDPISVAKKEKRNMHIIDGACTDVGGQEGKGKGGVRMVTVAAEAGSAVEAEVRGGSESTAALPRAGRPHAREGQRWSAPLGRSQYPGERRRGEAVKREGEG